MPHPRRATATPALRPDVPDVSRIAAALGHRTRARIVSALMGGVALTATELAAEADVASSTASEHLALLLDAGVLTLLRQGRHRYYRITGPDVAHAIESLMAATEAVRGPRRPPGPRDPAVRFARTCYDHLAGTLAVVIADRLLERGALATDGAGWALTPAGHALVARLGSAAEGHRHASCRPCLDWSERRYHLGGALGAALLARFDARGWLARTRGSRVVRLTREGRAGLARWAGVAVPPPGSHDGVG